VTAGHALEKIMHEQDSRMTRRTPGPVGGRLDDAAVLARSVSETDAAAVVARSVCDPDQFAVIYDRYVGEVYRYVAGRLGRDVAEDLAAETFLIAFRKRDRFDPALGRVRPWLYGIATTLVGQHRREETRRYRALARAGRRVLDSVESHDDRVADAVTAEQLGRKLAAALADLGHGDRDVLLLVAISELTHQEVALALDIPYGTVGSRLNRARRALREALGVVDPTLDHEEASNG
jgi:RNA polymerase sigma factor (sigma-70 family)